MLRIRKVNCIRLIWIFSFACSCYIIFGHFALDINWYILQFVWPVFLLLFDTYLILSVSFLYYLLRSPLTNSLLTKLAFHIPSFSIYIRIKPFSPCSSLLYPVLICRLPLCRLATCSRVLPDLLRRRLQVTVLDRVTPFPVAQRHNTWLLTKPFIRIPPHSTDFPVAEYRAPSATFTPT